MPLACLSQAAGDSIEPPWVRPPTRQGVDSTHEPSLRRGGWQFELGATPNHNLYKHMHAGELTKFQ